MLGYVFCILSRLLRLGNMAAIAEPRHQNGITADDWQGEQLGPRVSAKEGYSNVREQGLSTGVCVKGVFPV